MNRLVLILCACTALTACRDEKAVLPDPVPMTAEAAGYYCQMGLLEHPGPKAQVHLAGSPHPLFFSQVRDAVAYQRMPEQSDQIVVIYVSDMGAAPSWDAPGATNWIAADSALYVVGSAINGGMGAPELVPFSTPTAAAAFAAANGGTVLSLGDIADAAVLTPVDLVGGSTAGDDAEYEDRLRNLKSKPEG